MDEVGAALCANRKRNDLDSWAFFPHAHPGRRLTHQTFITLDHVFDLCLIKHVVRAFGRKELRSVQPNCQPTTLRTFPLV